MSVWWDLLDIRRELEYLPDDASRKRIWREVEAAGASLVDRHWLQGLIGIPALFIVGPRLGGMLWANAAIYRIGVRWVWVWGVAFALGFASEVFMVWWYRRRYRRLLRAAICHEGVPVCVRCGYNLSGHGGATRCPEIGTLVKVGT